MITEAVLQRAILEYLAWYSKKEPVYFFRSGAGSLKTESGRHFKTGKPGCPDITLCCRGVFYGLEVKTASGRLSALQKLAATEIQAAGGQYHVIRSLGDLKTLFPMEAP